MFVSAHAASNWVRQSKKGKATSRRVSNFYLIADAGSLLSPASARTDLDHRVWAPQKLDKARDDAALDNALDGRVSLL